MSAATTASGSVQDQRPGTSQAHFSGQSASPGIAYGRAHLHLGGLEEIETPAIQEDAVEAELARLDSVARAARVSLVRQREALAVHFTEDQRRVFDTHLQMLEDPVIEADVRERIASQHMSLEGAVKDALGVYERLFEVVESESLRSRLSDMRDVALRLLRFCRGTPKSQPKAALEGSVLVVKELSLADLTEALEGGVRAIAATGGYLGSHGAILTRAAGVPAVLGLGDVGEQVGPGDMLLVDGDAGQLIVNPSPEMVNAALGRETADVVELPPASLRDGSPVQLEAAVASPSEARTAAGMGVRRIGMYRTDLPVIQRQGFPKEASLVALYRQVFHVAEKAVFRLPDLDASCAIRSLYSHPEPNPALGVRGVRLLLERPELLNNQLRAIFKAAEGRPFSLLVPFVNDPSDLQPIREAIDNTREELRLEGLQVAHPVRLGAVLETPASALLGREILRDTDFVAVALDTLGQHLLAADRSLDHDQARGRLQRPHPVFLRAVRKLVQLAESLDKELAVYGEALGVAANLPLLVGLGVRQFWLRPQRLKALHQRFLDLDPQECEPIAEQVCRSSSEQEVWQQLPAAWREADEIG
ncbi:MAG: phosphoenolpyruvate--protein phosphotransferase [Planctomycetota bacterium]|nr:MAG: phosphoenolpyruvate--protein phosphotransferase [Planctomycetota bacterium]